MTQGNRNVSELVRKLKDTHSQSWQYLEVKQMAEILARHRVKLRQDLRMYRKLKEAVAAESDAIEKLYLGYEAMFSRDHLRDAIRLYVMVNHDYHEAYDAYMEEVQKPAASYTPVPAELLPTAKSRKAA